MLKLLGKGAVDTITAATDQFWSERNKAKPETKQGSSETIAPTPETDKPKDETKANATGQAKA